MRCLSRRYAMSRSMQQVLFAIARRHRGGSMRSGVVARSLCVRQLRLCRAGMPGRRTCRERTLLRPRAARRAALRHAAGHGLSGHPPPPASGALNYMLLTVARHPIDTDLAALDRALGFDWPAMMALASRHAGINAILRLAYISVLPQIALLVIVIGWRGRPDTIARPVPGCDCRRPAPAWPCGRWRPRSARSPSTGLPADVSAHLSATLDADYARTRWKRCWPMAPTSFRRVTPRA